LAAKEQQLQALKAQSAKIAEGMAAAEPETANAASANRRTAALQEEASICYKI
jgi:hypothetical protein